MQLQIAVYVICIAESMSEFDGLRKHEKTQHALVLVQAVIGLGRAALVAVVALPRYGSPNFPKWIIKCIQKLIITVNPEKDCIVMEV